MPDNSMDETRKFAHAPLLHTAQSGECIQDRTIRDILRELRDVRDRLNEGDKCLVRLQASVDTLTKAADELTSLVKEFRLSSSSSPLLSKALESMVQWAVPAIMFLLVFAAVKSGIVKIDQDTDPPKVIKVSP